MGSDRPIPRGSGEVDPPAIDDVSGVVAKKRMDETESALILRDVEEVGPQGVPAGLVLYVRRQGQVPKGNCGGVEFGGSDW